MSGKQVDVVVVGGGIGGLMTGAILAKREGLRVLLLEQERFLGGKIFSFEHSEFEPAEFRHLLYALTRSRVIRADPPLEDLLGQKAFRDFIFEGGWHGFIAADRSRASFILKALGRDLKVIPNRGFRWWQNNGWHELRDRMRDWTAEELQEGKEVSRQMNLMSADEASAFDHVDMRAYMQSRARSPRVRQFHEVLAGWETGLNDPALVSAGEHIKTVNLVHCSGRDFQAGGAGEPAGGFNSLTRAFAGIIEEAGGEIRTGTPVREVLLEDHAARGVRAETADGALEVTARAVVCNVPVQRAFSLIPRSYWPLELTERISRVWPLSGILGWVCTKPPMDPGFSGIYVVPVLPGCSAADGFRGDVLFSFEDAGVIDSSRVPPGHGLLAVWAGLLCRDPDEIHNPALVERVVEGIADFLKVLMPDFEQQVKWYFFTMAEELYSVSISPGLVGDRRLPVTHPTVKNLYFTGDSAAQWGFGISGVALSAVRCATAVSGRDQSVMLPFYMR
ncbi:MAG: FAD-dependent oxidoreductase [bacterium]